MSDYYSVKDISAILNVCPRTVYRLIQKAAFPAYRLSNTFRISRLDFHNWLDQQKVSVKRVSK